MKAFRSSGILGVIVFVIILALLIVFIVPFLVIAVLASLAAALVYGFVSIFKQRKKHGEEKIVDAEFKSVESPDQSHSHK